MNNVALYLRKSRDEDNESVDVTLARHELLLRDYCKRNKLNIIAVYKEVVSGENISNRPQMQKLLNDVENGLYNGVACVEIERLSRGNQIDQVEILEVFKNSKTKIYTLNKIYDLTNEDIDEEYFEFSLFMSRREYKVINRRMQRGRIQAMKEGYYIAPVTPYGYDKERQGRGFVLIPNKTEAENVKFMFESYVNGKSVLSITKDLNERGIYTRKGAKWCDTSIRQILENPVYIGKIHVYYNDIGTCDGKHAPIIDVDLFNAAQLIKKANTPKVKSNQSLKNPLAGLLYCGVCGGAICRSINGLGSVVYKCRDLSCKNRSIVTRSVESALIDQLKIELKDFNYILNNYEEDLKTKRQERDENIARIQKAIEKQNKALTVACEMLESGVYSVDLFKARTSAIEKNVEELKNHLETLQSMDIKDERAKKAVPILSQVLEQYDTLSVKDKNNLLKRIIKRIDYTRLDQDFTLDVELLI